METSDETGQVLRRIVRLAEEQGDALDRAFRLFGDGALLGAGAARLHEGMVERHLAVRRAFTRAFEQAERLAAARGDPPGVPAPHIRPPPEALRDPPGGYVGGDPDLMLAVDAELSRAGSDWAQAGQVLAGALTRLGLPGGPGHDVSRAGAWLTDQRGDLQRRRADLLKTTPAPPPPPVGETPFDQATGVAGEAVALMGEAWADGAEAVAGLIGAPDLGRLAREYTDRVTVPLAQGATESAVGIAEFAWRTSIGGIVTDPGALLEMFQEAGAAGILAAEHPVEFGKAVVDWDTLTEDPARWFGRLVPDVLLGLVTGGSAAAGRAGRAIGDVGERAPVVARAVEIPPPRTAGDGPPLDTTPLRPQYIGETGWGVEYLDAPSLETHRLVVHEGKLYGVDGKPFDTGKGMSIHSPEGAGRAIFVMDRYGNLYASNRHEAGAFHHSSFLAGRAVAGAGEMKVEDGVLTFISDRSGHYRPERQFLEQVTERLRGDGVSFEHVDPRFGGPS